MKLDAAFVRDAELIAEDVRAELGIPNYRPLDPRELFQKLDVPVISLSDLAALAEDPAVGEAVRFIQTEEAALSATTVFAGTSRMVVYNDAATPERQSSDLAHEAAHGLLLHQPAPAFDELGCRVWDDRIEAEAQHLGGCLLIPGKGARYAAKAGWDLAQIAREFDCSAEMARWRFNVSGGKRVASRRSPRPRRGPKT